MHMLKHFAWALAMVVSACATIDATVKPEVHVIGVYEGSYPPNAGHGSDVPYQIDVAIKGKMVPVVLVLMSYEPVSWQFSVDDGVRVSEVVLSSYHHARVIGLGSDVPVLRQAIGYAYKHDQAYDAVRKQLLERYGVEPKSFQFGYKGREFVVH